MVSDRQSYSVKEASQLLWPVVRGDAQQDQKFAGFVVSKASQ